MTWVRLYTKLECSLCEDARELLYRVRRERPFELEEVDIRTSAELFARYRYQVPVVEVDGVERLTLRFSEQQLRSSLETVG